MYEQCVDSCMRSSGFWSVDWQMINEVTGTLPAASELDTPAVSYEGSDTR